MQPTMARWLRSPGLPYYGHNRPSAHYPGIKYGTTVTEAETYSIATYFC